MPKFSFFTFLMYQKQIKILLSYKNYKFTGPLCLCVAFRNSSKAVVNNGQRNIPHRTNSRNSVMASREAFDPIQVCFQDLEIPNLPSNHG